MDISRDLLDRNISGRSRVMQPSQDPSDRMLTALVLHVVSTVLSKKNDPLVEPFVTILTNAQALKVSVNISYKGISALTSLSNIIIRYVYNTYETYCMHKTYTTTTDWAECFTNVNH